MLVKRYDIQRFKRILRGFKPAPDRILLLPCHELEKGYSTSHKGDKTQTIGGSYNSRYQGTQHDEAVMFKLGHYSPPIATSLQDSSKMQPRRTA
ncbi:hypothetical protein SEEM030_23056, partial [Salmonella enterica subsp. enterica serovar Montevideo str. SARB30]